MQQNHRMASSSTSERSSMQSDVASQPRERQESLESLSRTLTSSTVDSGLKDTAERQITRISRVSTQYEAHFDLERHPTALSRIQTGRSQHDQTVGASRMRSRQTHLETLPFGAGKPYPPLLPDREEYVVEFEGPWDPLHAQNWPLRRKMAIACTLAFVTLTASFGSSVFSPAIGEVAHAFHLSSEVTILSISLYVCGFACGPMLWAPISELMGRKLPILVASFGFSVFSIAVAVAKDAQTLFISRFFCGFFGACPLALVGAVFADMFNTKQRGLAITIFAATIFTGPMIAPFIGGFVVMNKNMGWRWTEYITAIMGFLGFTLCLVFVEETYPPIILVKKASLLRRQTLNWGIHAKQEEIEVDFRELLEKNLSRPLRMLFTEPIVLLLSIYMAFVYGLLYLFFSLYPAVFVSVHDMNLGESGLTYLGMILGELIAAFIMVMDQPRYNRKLAANDNIPIPEWRMPHAILGGVLFALGLFWFGWSGYRADVHWIVPTLSGLFTGFGLLTIFLQTMNYLIDSYTMFAASAIAANTLLRSICGAVFPLFAKYMIKSMGIQWTGTLLGCVALLLVPLPVLFWLKGGVIREKSDFAPMAPVVAQANRNLSEDGISEKDV